MYRLYLKHLIIKVCLYIACNKGYISCFKGHKVKACPFRDVPLLQYLRVWGGHRSSVTAFTATAFGVRFTMGTQTWGKYPPPLPQDVETTDNHERVLFKMSLYKIAMSCLQFTCMDSILSLDLPSLYVESPYCDHLYNHTMY